MNNSDVLAQHRAKEIGIGDTSGAALSAYPAYHALITQEQQDAASTLKDFNNHEIFVLLKLARSTRHIEPIPEQRPGERHLSPSQVLALSTLKDCPDDRLLGWLELARRHCHTTSSDASPKSLESEPGSGTVIASFGAQPKQSAAELTVGLEAAALVPNPWTTQFAIDNFSGHNSSRSSNSRSKNGDNHYWCTVCEELKSYKDSGSWKKHEKEHETIFVCGLDDATEASRACQSHASKPFTCKRRDVMVHHLNKLHGIFEANRGRELADQWRHTVRKQAWSCGFCINVFLTFQDRLRHVDTEHFKKHQSIHEWDLNKVILGLLQQPKIEKAWKARTASLTPWVQPESFAWDKATAKGLRARLEIGPLDDRHADSLADAACSACIRNEESRPQSGIAYTNHHADATAQLSLLSSPIPYQAISALASGPGLYQRPESAIAGDSSFVEAPTSSFALGNTAEPSMSSTSLDDEGRVDYNALLFNPSQGWTPASDPGAFFSYERSETYGG